MATYTVRAGDSLYGIARRFGVPWTDIARENGISNPNIIFPGQQLRIPGEGRVLVGNFSEQVGVVRVDRVVNLLDGYLEVIRVLPPGTTWRAYGKFGGYVNVGGDQWVKESLVTFQEFDKDGYFRVPVPDGLVPRCRVTSGYGPRTIWGRYQFHNGIDLGPSQVVDGQPALAAAAGHVSFSQYSQSAGHFVSVNHPNGMSSRYLHLRSRSVRVGEEVRKGQEVGRIGSTGMSTAPHLHFDLWRGNWPNGQHVDPAEHIPSIG